MTHSQVPANDGGVSLGQAFGEVSRRISIWLTPDVKPGDYVLLHTGYAINIIDEDEAKETLSLLEEVADGLDSEAG